MSAVDAPASRLTPPVSERVRKIIASVIEVEIERVTDDAYLGVDLGADVLDQVELEVEIEDEFDVRFADDEFEIKRQTRVCDVIAQVQRKLAEGR
ncbi:unannotated protein [freshwater metagenome]|uniref:Unannotated protein n=1 Tax=freshwater metagenome TaxID=449393 RepID=A0A6J7KHF7_9ZZZZ|nr:acyl carrier protein [Actinomycetota bacterium]